MHATSRLSFAVLSAAIASCVVATQALGAAAESGAGPATQNAPAASGSAQKYTFSAAQVQEIQNRSELAANIVKNVEADATAKGASDSWRRSLLALLYNTPSGNLRDIAGAATTLNQAHVMADAAISQAKSAAPIAKSLGSSADSLVFTPITPCRFIDTRNLGTPITTPQDFDTFASGSSYGGDANCTVPGTGEPAIAMNITAVVAAGKGGYLGIRPYGSTSTTSLLNWPSTGAPAGIANAAIVTTGLRSSDEHYVFEAFTGGGGANAPQMIVDYFGYFSPAAATALSCTTAPTVGATIATGHHSVTSNACPSGYAAVSAICGSGANIVLNTFSLDISAATSTCYYDNNTGADALISASTVCCVVP